MKSKNNIVFLWFGLIITSFCLNITLYGQENACPVDADIWVLAGQSQMAGAGREPDTTTNPNIWMLNLDNLWMTAQNPLHRIFEAEAPAYENCYCDLLPEPLKNSPEAHEQFRLLGEISKQNPIGGVGPGMYFAKHIYENTGRPIGLIPSALGGSRMDQWYPELITEGDSSLYGAMINRIHSVGIENIKGFIWSQGESEAMLLETDKYENDLISLINAVRNEVNNPSLPVILVQIGRFNIYDQCQDRSWEIMREIQRQVSLEMDNVFLVTGIDLPLDDCVHISTDGQKRLGKRLAEIALTYAYNKEGFAEQIKLESVSISLDNVTSSNYIKLHYSGICGKLSAAGEPSEFELRVNNQLNFSYVVSKVEFDPFDDAGLRLYLSALPDQSATLVCGSGTYPYMNIVDSRDNAIPALGPINVSMTTTNINEIEQQIPNGYQLYQNYPNPFNPSTSINYCIQEQGIVTLKVYNLVGEEVATLVNAMQNAGSYSVEFNASGLASGIYIYRLMTGNIVLTKKLTLIK